MSEHDNQVTVFEFALLHERKWPELALMFAIPNGGKRTPAQAGMFRAEGVKSGVPDICLPIARGKFSSLFIEMKDGDKRPTVNQTAWLERLDRFGNCAVVCQSADEAIKVLEWYLKGAE
jgi:hypothetical protein